MNDVLTGQIDAPYERAKFDTSPVPLTRLVRVELRKLTDTRSGRWLLVAIAVITAAVITVFLFSAAPGELTYRNFVNATGTPQGLLITVLATLTVTSEWGQRTGLVTLTLEPNRGRVVVAKLIAVLLLGTAAALTALGLAAIGNLLGAALQDGNGSWTFGLAGIRDILAVQTIGVLQGLALGLLFMNSAGAIVTFFAVPTIGGIPYRQQRPVPQDRALDRPEHHQPGTDGPHDGRRRLGAAGAQRADLGAAAPSRSDGSACSVASSCCRDGVPVSTSLGCSRGTECPALRDFRGGVGSRGPA